MPNHRIDIEIRPDIQGQRRAIEGYRKIDRAAGTAVASGGRLNASFLRQQQRAGQFRREVSRLSLAMGEASSKASGMARIMAYLGVTISGFAIYSSVRGMIHEFSEWELALIGVSKTTTLTKKELAELEDRVLKLSRVVPIAAEEILAIAQAAGQVGVEGVDNLINFSRAIADLGIASDVGGEMAVLALKKILDLSKEGDDQVRYLASSIVALGNTFPALESQIVSTTLEVSKALAPYNVASTDSAAIATGLISSGVAPQLSRSAMQKFFHSMNKAILGNKKLMTEWIKVVGISEEEFQKLWKTDKVKLFIKAMEGFESRGDRVSLTMEKVGLSGARLNAVFPSLAKNVDQLNQAVATTRKEALNPTALDEEVEKFYGAFKNQLSLVSAHVGEARALFGKGISPALIEAANGIKIYTAALVDSGAVVRKAAKFNELLMIGVNNFQRILTYLGSYLIYKLSKYFWVWITTMTTATGTATGLSVAVARLLTVMKTLGKLAVFLILVEGIHKLFQANKEANELINIDPSLSKADIFKVKLGEVLSATATIFSKSVAVTKTIFIDAWTYIAEGISNLWKQVMTRIVDYVVVVADKIRNTFLKVYIDILGGIRGLWDWITQPIREFAELVDKLEQKKRAIIDNALDTGLGETLGVERQSGSIFNTGLQAFSAQLGSSVEGLSNRVESLQSTLETPNARAKEASERLAQPWVNPFASATDSLSKTIDNVAEAVNGVSPITVKIAEEGIVNRVGNAREKLASQSGLASPIDPEYPDRLTGPEGKGAPEDFIDRWANAIARIQNEFRGLFTQQLPDMVAQTFTSIADGSIRAGEAFKQLGFIIAKSVIETLIAAVVQAAIFRAVAGTAFGNFIGVPGGGGSGGPSGIGVAPPGTPAAPGYGYVPAARGGLLIPSFAGGGPVRGQGGPRDDGVMARLSHGEFVVNSRSTNKYLSLLEAINGEGMQGSGGTQSRGTQAPSIVIEDRRPPSAPRLEIEQGETTFSQGQVQQVRFLIKEENHQGMRKGEYDRTLEANFGVSRRPVAR